MQTTEQFFEDAKKAGFTKPALWTPSAGGAQQSYDVVYRAPTEEILAGQAKATDRAITYPASIFPGLKRGEVVNVDGVDYKLREDPGSELDGSRFKALLSKES
jgi:hypothetical protein